NEIRQSPRLRRCVTTPQSKKLREARLAWAPDLTADNPPKTCLSLQRSSEELFCARLGRHGQPRIFAYSSLRSVPLWSAPPEISILLPVEFACLPRDPVLVSRAVRKFPVSSQLARRL